MPDDAMSVERLAQALGDRNWRLSNLYWILDKQGRKVLLKPNRVQRELLSNLHFLNIVLKARQLGLSTIIQILILDLCLFNSNVQAGVIAHSLDDAQAIFDTKIKFAYDNLPDWLREIVPATTDHAGELVFANGSRIRVATSLRSQTMQIVHVSEYGKICRKFPDRAKEVKTGTLQTVAPGQHVVIESTAEGKFGDFYDMTKAARARGDDPRPLQPMEYKFHFFPWFDDPAYIADPSTPIPKESAEYFDGLESKHGIKLSPEQRAWYVLKSRELGDDMKQEYPSVPDEAFEQAIEGAFYVSQMRAVRKAGQIRPIPVAPSIPVHTFWDIGFNDMNSIWFMQEVAGQPRFVHSYQNAGEGFSHYVNYINARGWVRGKFFLPHDAEDKRISAHGGRSAVDEFADLNIPFNDLVIVPRVAELRDGIEAVRKYLPLAWIDPEGCADGIIALDSYRKTWDDKLAVWREQPVHDQFSHYADAFRQWPQAINAGLYNFGRITASSASTPTQRLPKTGRVC